MCPRVLMWRRRSAESAGPRGTLFGRRHFSETNDNYPCRSMGDASTMNESHAALTRLFFTFEIWTIFYAWSDDRAGHFEVTSSVVRPGVESARQSMPGW